MNEARRQKDIPWSTVFNGKTEKKNLLNSWEVTYKRTLLDPYCKLFSHEEELQKPNS